VGAMRIDAFRPADEFKTHMDKWIKAFRQAKSVNGQPNVQIPGDQERLIEKERKNKGIHIHPDVLLELNRLSNELGIKL
jgi:LDH2 family malate/lactate/ureidoglycolate dehydrogenase